MEKHRKAILGALLVTLALTPFVSAEETYDWVVPMEYGEITAAFDGRILVRNSGLSDPEDPWKDVQDLYGNDGTLLLSGKWNCEFYENYIVAEDEGGAGLWRREDLTEVTPERFKRVCLTGPHTAAACTEGEFCRPGYWQGTWVELDLRDGRVTKTHEAANDGFFDALFHQWPVPGELVFANTGGPYGVVSSETPPRVLRNSDGQLLMDCAGRPGWLSYGGNGTLAWYNDPDITTAGGTGYAETYTLRGRLLGKYESCGVYGGRYLLRCGQGQYLTDRDGETVIAPGVFDVYHCNLVDNSTGEVVCEDDDMIIVGKDGKYGVIRLKDRLPQPSEWAREEAALADAAGIVPEDMKLWWRDSCTRLEFCQMLARTVTAASGKTMGEWAEGASPIAFSDCSDPDVLAASSLGIVQGVGSGKFAPGQFLTRQQAATMLGRAASLLHIEGTSNAAAYNDQDEIAAWAAEGVAKVSTIVSRDGKAVMQGVGGGRFSPKSYYTVEQSALTLYRLLRSAGENGAADVPSGELTHETDSFQVYEDVTAERTVLTVTDKSGRPIGSYTVANACKDGGEAVSAAPRVEGVKNNVLWGGVGYYQVAEGKLVQRVARPVYDFGTDFSDLSMVVISHEPEVRVTCAVGRGAPERNTGNQLVRVALDGSETLLLAEPKEATEGPFGPLTLGRVTGVTRDRVEFTVVIGTEPFMTGSFTCVLENGGITVTGQEPGITHIWGEEAYRQAEAWLNTLLPQAEEYGNG